jgi:hypothetical protein
MVIRFAHQAFLWSNSARGQAGVSCVVVGMGLEDNRSRELFTTAGVMTVKSISPYLRPGPATVVTATTSSIVGLPTMSYGNMPLENGHLMLEPFEREEILDEYPEAERFIRNYVGSHEFINEIPRYCIWVPEDQRTAAEEIPPLSERFALVRAWRERSKSATSSAATPHLFHQRCHQDVRALVIPIVSSEQRDYVPIGFAGPTTIASNATQVVYGAEPWLFGLLQSRAHMVWLRAVGGRLENRLRYSSTLVYNSFPVPRPAGSCLEDLSAAALGILAQREAHPEKTLADLYAPGQMPRGLATAHDDLDSVVDAALSGRSSYVSDDERAERLLVLYEERVAGGCGAESN